MATVVEYEGWINANDSKIEKYQSQAKSYRAKASASKTKAIEWRNQKGNKPDGSCGGLKKKRIACENDAAWKESKAQYYDNQAATLLKQAKELENVEIPALRNENAEFTKQIASAQESSEEVARELALQGFTAKGLTDKLRLEGEGAKARETEIGKSTGEAIKTASTSQAETDATNKKNLAMVGVAIGVVIVVIGGIFIYKRIKKLKKAKK